MGFDTAYEAISEEADAGHRWAFGTGFADPLAGVDTTLPDGVDGADLGAYCLMLGDDALIMSHRLQQWLARAPELEGEAALANIALDPLGPARLLGGTDYWRGRIEAGLGAVAPLTAELFAVSDVERRLIAAEVAADPGGLRSEFEAVIGVALAEEDLAWPDVPPLTGVAGQAGRDGIHTEAMGYLLAELQSLARALPGATW